MMAALRAGTPGAPRPVGFVLAALITVLASGCASIGGVPVDEAAELATMGRERELRETPRPIRGTTRVLVFALDGVGSDALQQALDEGRLPAISRLLGAGTAGEGVYDHGYVEPGLVSVLPSATTPAWATIFTGEAPGRTGLPGNEWFDRREMSFYAPIPVSVASRDHATKIYTDELLSELIQVPTLFEQLDLRAHVSMLPVFRGADLLTLPNLSNLGDLAVNLVEGAFGGEPSADPDVHRETDQSATRSLLGAIDDYGVPDVQVVYFPGTDLLTHQVEDPLERQQRYLHEVTGPEIEKVLDAYREHGALDDTYVVLISDHGHTPLPYGEESSLDAEDEVAEVLREAGFRVRSPSTDADAGDFQAVIAYQGGTAFVYLADRGTCAAQGETCDWSRPPREADVLTAARAFYDANRTGAAAPGMRGSLDLVLARTAAQDGAARPFRIYDGERLTAVEAAQKNSPAARAPRLAERLRDLAEGPYGWRAGDLLLVARSGAEVPFHERFHFAPPAYSDHGSPYAMDSRVPLVVIHPSLSGSELRERVRAVTGDLPSQMDFAPLLRALLDMPSSSTSH